MTRVLVGRAAALVASAVMVVLGTAAPVAAHATLVSTSPADGEVLDDLPDGVSLTFSETMTSPAYVTVTAPDGADLTAGRPAVEGAVVSQDLVEGDQTGTYVLAFRAVSKDGHPLTGQLSFHVGEPSDAAPETPGAGRSPTPTEPGSSAGASEEAGPLRWGRRATDLTVAGVLFGVAGLLWVGSRRSREP